MAHADRWIVIGTLTVLGGAALALAADPAPKPLTPLTPAPAMTQPATQPSSEQVLEDLMHQRQPGPVIEPSVRPPASATAHNPLLAVLQGIAPGQPLPAPRREGEFIVSRRGRMIHPTGASGPACFAFDGDTAGAPQPPMVLLPGRVLQEMEDLVGDRDDQTVFILSGEIFLYRGVNYLLPTLMQSAVDMGNLKH